MLALGDFAGTWRLDRVIADRLAGQEGRLSGRAVFTESAPDQLSYHESGTLKLDTGHQMAARFIHSCPKDMPPEPIIHAGMISILYGTTSPDGLSGPLSGR